MRKRNMFFIFSMLVLMPQIQVVPSVSLNKGYNILQQGYITVSGYWRYWIDSETRWPLALATVVIYDLETGGILIPVDAVYTDSNGYFVSNPILNDDGPGEDGLDIVVRVLSTSPAATVVNPSINWYYYTQTEVFLNQPDGPLSIGTRDTSWNDRGAWWIFSAHFGLTQGYLYLWSEVGYAVPTATARWPYETWPHYHPGGEIHLPSWACWWPDMILHEYGHHVMYSLYGYIPPSMGEHSINLRSNSTTAWAEGWADFFPLAVFNDPVFTWSNGTHWADINLETPTWYTLGWDSGDEVEGRVAGALWDIFDSQNDNAPWYYDSFSDGFTRIWNAMSGAPRNTFREFWQAWNITYYARQQTLLAIFQNTIDYRGPGDVNADCYVGMDDIYMIAYHFGRQIGDPDWDVRRDLNMDGYIGIDDIFIASSNYGNQY
jgi:hypothetical protein